MHILVGDISITSEYKKCSLSVIESISIYASNL